MKHLEDLNSQEPFKKDILDEPFFRYFISNRSNGDIKGAGASRETLMKFMSVRCWDEYEILTRKQYITKWGNKL